MKVTISRDITNKGLSRAQIDKLFKKNVAEIKESYRKLIASTEDEAKKKAASIKKLIEKDLQKEKKRYLQRLKINGFKYTETRK